MNVVVVLLTLGVALAQRNVTLIAQAAGSGQILCQCPVDLAGPPTLMAADDVALPAEQCQALYVSLQVLRQRVSADPISLVVQLLSNQAGLPGTLLFRKSWPWNALANSVLNRPTTLTLTLRQGDLGDDRATPLVLAPGSVVWLALYAIAPLNRTGTLGQNAFYWLTSPTGGASSSFAYRDVTNLQHWNLTAWTLASVAGPLLGVRDAQMAWRVDAECPSLPTAAPTPATTAPTRGPTPQPTTAPTTEPRNLTEVAGSRNVLTPALAVSLPLAFLLTLALAFFLWRRRQRQQAEAVQKVDLREKLVRPQTVDFDHFVDSNPFRPQGDDPVRVFTSGREMVDIPLSESSNGAYRRIFDDSIAASSDGD